MSNKSGKMGSGNIPPLLRSIKKISPKKMREMEYNLFDEGIPDPSLSAIVHLKRSFWKKFGEGLHKIALNDNIAIMPPKELPPRGWMPGKKIVYEQEDFASKPGLAEVPVYMFKGVIFYLENDWLSYHFPTNSKIVYAVEKNRTAMLWEEQIKLNLSAKTWQYILWTMRGFEDAQAYLKMRKFGRNWILRESILIPSFRTTMIAALVGQEGVFFDLDRGWWKDKLERGRYLAKFTVRVKPKTFNILKRSLGHFHRVQDCLGEITR